LNRRNATGKHLVITGVGIRLHKVFRYHCRIGVTTAGRTRNLDLVSSRFIDRNRLLIRIADDAAIGRLQ